MPKLTSLPLHYQIFIAIVAAVIMGLLTRMDASIFSISFYSIYDFIGTLFLNALKMVVVPLVASSIICGVSNFGSGNGLGRLGIKTIAFYLSTSTLAIMVGLVTINVIEPGIIGGSPAGEQLIAGIDDTKTANLVEKVTGRDSSDIAAVFLRMIPTNVVAAAADGQMLGLIFFSIVFGLFMMQIKPSLSATLRDFWVGVFDTMMKITMWVMRFAPIGVFGLVAKTVAATGFATFISVFYFFIGVLFALFFHLAVTQSLLLHFIGGLNPLKFFKAMNPALLMAFSTSSSSATLPVTIKCIQENVGVSNKTSSFVLPLGATVNMDGTALYECMAAMFIAQVYGLELSFATQLIIVITALLTSIGVAGIPSASLVAISIILTTIGLPLEGLGLLLITDRVLDMLRTSVNIYGDSCGATIIASSEGEKELLKADGEGDRVPAV